MYYVYILICSDKKHMKIGVSSKNLNRVLKHHKTYSILIDKSRFIPLTDKKLAFKVEKFLLSKIPHLEEEMRTNDGHTELRDVRFAKFIKDYLKEIKKSPEFSYNDSIRMNYNLYKVEDLLNEFKSHTLIDYTQIEKQYEKLKIDSDGSVDKKKWKYITEVGKNWASRYKIEDKD
jgi:hypothetical protein